MLNLFLDILFPQHECCICRVPGKFSTRYPWCGSCQQNLVELQTCLPICQKCGKYMLEKRPLCRDCRVSSPDFAIARAVGPYEEPYRVTTKVLKFLGRRQLAVRMGDMMAEVVKSEPRFWPIDVIVPVPASQASLQQRGFNQTEVLGRQISKRLKLRMVTDALERVKETPSQRELTREEREKNLLQAFNVKDNKKIYRKNILLVDDVYTTGSTSRECTRTLLEGGAARVAVITWATGKGY
ncbi:double zinc ribbon domain-containing protein [Syntrophomonas erecta]